MKGIGSGIQKQLAGLGIETLEDLIYHFPRRYLDRSQVVPIRGIRTGEEVTVVGTVKQVSERKTARRRSLLQVSVYDGTAYLVGVWFNQPYLAHRFKVGMEVAFSGKAQYRYNRQVQETIQQVEQAYWQLVAARRNLPVIAELVAQTEQVLRYFEIRAAFDVQPVQVANTRARLAGRRAELITSINQIRDAEAQLKALINDPSLPIPDDAAIIPTDLPAIDAVVLNRLVEIKTALDNRPELAQARAAVQSARTGVTVANNQRLPRLDVLFRYTVNGLGGNPDAAFDELTENDFVDYLVGVQFEWPIGNRAAEAVYRQAQLQLAQAIAAVKQAIERVVAEVDIAYRNLDTRYREMLPIAAAVLAEADNLRAIQQRADRRDPTFLDLELNTQTALAQSRRSLLDTWVQYSIGIVNLELAKGTLLVYDNVRLEPRQDER